LHISGLHYTGRKVARFAALGTNHILVKAMIIKKASVVLLLLACALAVSVRAADKPKLTLDEFFNSVAFSDVRLSPDGNAVVIGTERADWENSVFRKDLWLYRDGKLIQLTQSGHDTAPQWSPDGKWIAFLSERKSPFRKADSDDSDPNDGGVDQLHIISASGGEAFALTQGEEDVHAFAWSPDSRTLYFAVRSPWNKDQKDAYKKEWKDTRQYRASERGDVIFSLDLAEAVVRLQKAVSQPPTDPEKTSDATPGTQPIATTPWRVEQMVVSADGQNLAFTTSSISEREEKVEEFEIFNVDLPGATPQRLPRQLTRNAAVEHEIYWAPGRHRLFFDVEIGDVSGPYRDLQPHLYWVDSDTGHLEQWSQDFVGAVNDYAPAGNGVLVAGREGTEVQLYSAAKPSDSLAKLSGWAGTYDLLATAAHSPRVAFVYSSLEKPTEVYLADSMSKLADARPITSFNKLFMERDLPQGKPYRWKADDGTDIEGMLIYPPGKFGAKNLPMFTLIHGGPADADGNHFEADWYQWDRLAATQGWLVFEPNYRGSTGYGDKFLMEIVPQIVSRPGKDILEGIDALVKDGIADPERLAVGGYSYGGYMTNWLITQTTRFKAAVTGAGAVEHVANWGNDDTTFDDAYFLGGLPWEAAQRYHDEAAIFQINKVKTPTHMVAGADDIRVAVLENYLLEHALHVLGIPNALLIFPGEGHSLSKNPWHGKIKVREELKWLEKYGGIAAGK
jgi:dipeptidyl aminopeptidase/acylaminoacyl peptidase